MARLLLALWCSFLTPLFLFGEEGESWDFSVAASTYILSDKTYVSPVVSADKEHLHLEARYNDEDLETTSFFAGYNFHAGETLNLNVTPIIGGVFGNTNGIAPGFLFELNYKMLTVSSQGEYLISSEEKESSFFYSWSEITLSPVDWFWFGMAGQRTRAYKTDLEIQRGFLAGFGKGNFAISGYVMNLGWGDPFGVIVLEYEF